MLPTHENSPAREIGVAIHAVNGCIGDTDHFEGSQNNTIRYKRKKDYPVDLSKDSISLSIQYCPRVDFAVDSKDTVQALVEGLTHHFLYWSL